MSPQQARPAQDALCNLGLQVHEQRITVAGELHARPFERMRSPASLSHLAMLGGSAEHDRAHVAELCLRLEQTPPAPGATHHSVELGAFRLRWERHTEFSTYTCIVTQPAADPRAPFAHQPLERVPREWLQTLPGQVVAAVHLVLEQAARGERDAGELFEFFGTENVAGSRVADGGALVFTDFRLHHDGFARILIQVNGLTPRRCGRMVQRVLEIETYRLMALLAFPVARETSTRLGSIEDQLQVLSARLAGDADLEDEQVLLTRLSVLAGELEGISAANSFRLSAARAYHALVDNRLLNLREERLPDLQTLGEFMERRFNPAMRTCESVRIRQDHLSARLSRATELLRTRVDVALEGQNRDLLASMNRRTDLQLRLQQTVEGLSVVVLTYYGTGLVSYVSKGLEAAGLSINTPLTVAASVPLIALSVWFGLSHMRRRIEHRHAGNEPVTQEMTERRNLSNTATVCDRSGADKKQD